MAVKFSDWSKVTILRVGERLYLISDRPTKRKERDEFEAAIEAGDWGLYV